MHSSKRCGVLSPTTASCRPQLPVVMFGHEDDTVGEDDGGYDGGCVCDDDDEDNDSTVAN